MKKLIGIIIVLLGVFIGTISGVAEVNENKNQYPKEVSVHDPSIIRDVDGKYYVFGSHITTAVSNDLINWTYKTWGYYTPSNLHFGNLSENLKGSFKWAGEDDSDCKGGFAVWAPDVYYNPKYVWKNGKIGVYMMYYSASSTYKRSCIGLAVSDNINGPYEYVDTIIYSGFTKNDGKDENSTHSKEYTNTNLNELIKNGRVSGYKGVFFKQKNNNGETVMTFTAVGGENSAIWGVKIIE